MGFYLVPFVGTRLSLGDMNLVYCGSPQVMVPARESVDVFSMNFVYCGSPLVTYSRG